MNRSKISGCKIEKLTSCFSTDIDASKTSKILRLIGIQSTYILEFFKREFIKNNLRIKLNFLEKWNCMKPILEEGLICLKSEEEVHGRNLFLGF